MVQCKSFVDIVGGYKDIVKVHIFIFSMYKLVVSNTLVTLMLLLITFDKMSAFCDLRLLFPFASTFKTLL